MKTRFNSSLPKIGIRPIIDGRRNGVRESLEDQTMNMAKAVEKLLKENLRYPSGEVVECVIADSTIGGVSEAARCADKFAKEGVGVTISVTPCWCYGTETIDMDPFTPKAIWGFNGAERPGAVYLAAALAGHNQKGVPAFGIYGRDVQEKDNIEIPEDVKTKLLQFSRAGLTVALMKGKSYLAQGSVSMGIAGSIMDASFFQKYLGMRNEYVDMSEYTRRIEEKIYDKEEYEKAMKWVKENCREGKDYYSADNMEKSRENLDSDWETVVKMTLISRDLMIGNPKLKELGYEEEAEGHNAIASGFQGQRQWTDHSPNADFMEAILNSSFDWNGIREAFVVATENDSLNAVSMLFGHLLTGTAQIFSDVRTYWSPEAVKRITGKELTGLSENGIIHLINSGATTLDATGKQTENGKPVMKQFYNISEEEVKKCLEATSWCPANRGYFRGGGFSSKFVSEGNMPVTMCRINIIDGLGPILQIAEGYTVELEEDVHTVLDMRTDPAWPTTWFAPKLTGKDAFTDVYSVMNNWGANHGAISFGHIGADLITLASMLRIPVAMHNVSEDRIFRPTAWGAFGTKDKESADFRACENFGPLYGKK